MGVYYCYFVGDDGQIDDVAELTAGGDGAAIREARRLVAYSAFSGFELRQEGRRVALEIGPADVDRATNDEEDDEDADDEAIERR
jgi:hypothetical protein